MPGAAPKRGWLEIVREPGTAEAVAFCPYRSRMLHVADCFACKDCLGLAMDGRGKHSYVVCERAETDGIATAACPSEAPLDDTEAWSVRVLVGAPPDDPDER
jgi:hypothetical protein